MAEVHGDGTHLWVLVRGSQDNNTLLQLCAGRIHTPRPKDTAKTGTPVKHVFYQQLKAASLSGVLRGNTLACTDVGEMRLEVNTR